MNTLSNQYALAAIRERRAELAGEITQLESRLRHLRESLVHVDGTLRLFAPNADELCGNLGDDEDLKAAYGGG